MKTDIINDRLKDKNGRPYFLTIKKKKTHIYTDDEINAKITNTDNICLPIVQDNEFTQTLPNLEYLTIDYLEKNENKQLYQINQISRALDHKTKKNIYTWSAKNKRSFINSHALENVAKIKQQKILNISTQYKHILYEDAEILLNPKVNNFYKKHVTDEEYQYHNYSDDGKHDLYNLDLGGKGGNCAFIDYLNLKLPYEVSIKRFSDFQDFKSYEQNTTCGKLPFLYLKIFTYFGIVDFPKTFQGTYLEDILQLFIKGKLTHNKRLIANGYQQSLYPFWIINLGGLEYKVAIKFFDISGLHGKVGYQTVLENLGMSTDDKQLLDDYKDNMLYAMIIKYKEFKRYALGDLLIYEMFKGHNKLLKGAYKQCNIEEFFTESKLTTGAFVNDLQKAVLKKRLNVQTDEELKQFVYTASPQHLRGYTNIHLYRTCPSLTKHLASKTPGGRCYNNKLLDVNLNNLDIWDFTICDIDISSAYTTYASALSYYFGNPVIENFLQYKVTLRQYLKFKKKELLIDKKQRNFKFVVETKTIGDFSNNKNKNKKHKEESNDNLLKIEQDRFPSFYNLNYKSQYKKDKNNNVKETYQFLDLDNIKTDIFTRELKNTVLTFDDIDWILKECDKKQKDELLDNVYMINAIYYPESMRCKNIEELKAKRAEHEQHGNGTYNKTTQFSSIDPTTIKPCHYWCDVNFGDLICDVIRFARAQYKKDAKTMTLAYLFKLIGNTLYGDNVSQYFEISNIVFAANITSMGRAAMWYVEKALNIIQTITDGGVFHLNKVVHLIYNKIDTSFLTRAYQYNNRELTNNNKWNTKSITKNGKKIEYHKNKGWLIDDKYYGCDVDYLLSIEKELKDLNKNKELNILKIELLEEKFKFLKNKINEVYKIINNLALEHVQKVFSKNSLLNDEYRHFKTDDKGEILCNDNNEIQYETKKGLFKFEVKNLTSSVSFHGSADYIYTDINRNIVVKMRGYEAKKNIIAWSLNEDNVLTHNLELYKNEQPIVQFLNELKNNSQAVRLPIPFTKSTILKPAQYKQQYRKTFKYSNIIPGDEYYEVVAIPIFTLRFKFISIRQKINWSRYIQSLKNRYGGLSLEIFFMNNDGTINYEEMIRDIDKHISNYELYPNKIFDKNNHLKRDFNNKYVIKHVELIRQLKNLYRILLIGLDNFAKENFKFTDNDINIIPLKYENNKIKEYYNDYEDVGIYSNENNFKDYEDNSIRNL